MIKLKELYEQCEVTELNIGKEITLCNCNIFKIIYDIVNYNKDLKEKDLITLTNRFIQITKYTSIKNSNINGIEMLNEIQQTVGELIEEFSIKENPVLELCYLLGTSSEIESNYSLVTRMIIIYSIAKIKNIEFDF